MTWTTLPVIFAYPMTNIRRHITRCVTHATITGAIPTTGVNDASSDDEDVFHSEGSGLQDTLTGPEVSALLISNGSRLKPAKWRRGFVSVDNHTGYSKSEPKAVRLRADALRSKDNRIRAKK
jgi:hypothetical protein